MNYQYSVSEEGIKRVLADMFTSPSTFLTELCQNSQRAGATRIDICYSEADRMLTVADDGRGFTEQGWQSFFVVGSSGWGDDVIKEQKPFGFGCAACLFAASEINIASLSKEVRFETDAFLSGSSVESSSTEGYVQGATISLKLKDSVHITNLLANMESVFRAFTIPVFLNGKEIERPLALDSDRVFIETELGMLTLVDTELKRGVYPSCVRKLDIGFILQGYRLSNSDYCPAAWIHLHSSQFRARVPDRHCLVGDVSSITESARAILKSVYKQELVAKRSEMGIEQFAIKYWFEALKYAPEMLENAPIPAYLIWSAEDIPYEDYNSFCASESHHSNQSKRAFYPADLKGEFFFELIAVSGVAEDEDDDQAFLMGNYAYLVNNQFFSSNSIPAGHWLKHQIVQSYIDESKITSTLLTSGEAVTFNVSTAGYYNQEVVLCDSFHLCVDGLSTLDDEPAIVGKAESNSDAIWFDGKLYIPKDCRNLDAVCRQTVNMNKSEDYFDLDEQFLGEVSRELWAVVSTKRGSSVKDLLQNFIQEHNSELQALRQKLIGNTFEVTFANQEGYPPIKVSVNDI